MAAPSATLKALQNEETGIDISVCGIHEEEAPLGGISILYQVCLLTKLDVYKSSLHKAEDVVQFSVFKAYREIEDFHNKLFKKYPAAKLPPIPKASATDKYTNEEKLKLLNEFMQYVSKNVELCQSSIFTHFIGVDSPKTFTITNNVASEESPKIVPESKNKESEDLADVFPKVKSTAIKPENKISQVTSKPVPVDLFEEVKIVKETDTSSQKRISGSLFDDFEDDNLFSTKPTPKSTSISKQAEQVPKTVPKKKEPEKQTEPVDDSVIIIKDRKLGEISLFDEQDMGDYITKEEEALFLVTPADESNKKNQLLFSSKSEPVETTPEPQEDLDELLSLTPLPVSPSPKEPEPLKSKESEATANEKLTEVDQPVNQPPKKPVPLPRKKSLGKNDTDELTMTKPEVMPRKVFLSKPEVPSKPASSRQEISKSSKPPPVSAKPTVLPKPKPPIKGPKPSLRKNSKDLDVLNANEPQKVVQNENNVSTLAEDLNKFDILKYIEQEQKTLESEPSLFD